MPTSTPAPAAPQPGARDNGALLGVAFCLLAATAWGTTGTAATFAPGVPAVAIGAAAMGFGGLLQAALAWRGIRAAGPALRRQLPLLIAGGLSVAIYPLAFYASMRLAGVTIGTVISIGSAPLISALIENRLEGIRLTMRWMSGAVIGIAGMALLALAEGHGAAGGDNVPMGVALGLVAGATYAHYSWVARRLMQRGLPSRVAMGAMLGVGALCLLPVLALTGAAFLDSGLNLAVGLYMALVPMFLGYIAFGAGLARVSTSMATTVTLFEPVVAAILAVLVVGERLAPLGWLGVGLIIGCLFWTTIPLPGARARGRRA